MSSLSSDPLAETAHRPYPLPSGPWVMAQRWNDLLFIHRQADVETLRAELRDRFGPPPPPADAMLALASLRVGGGALGIEGILVRGDEARINFRDTAVPRMKGLSAAFHDVQFQAEVRRAKPLSLKLTRLGGGSMLEGLVRALKAVA